MSDNSALYLEILDALKVCGISHRRVAKYLDVSPETLSRRKSGKCPVSAEALYALRWFASSLLIPPPPPESGG